MEVQKENIDSFRNLFDLQLNSSNSSELPVGQEAKKCLKCNKKLHCGKKFCSYKCANSGKNNPMYGKKHTLNTIEKMGRIGTYEERYGSEKAEKMKTSQSKTKKELFKKGILKPNSGCFKKGHKSEAGFKKGMIPWNKGLTKETDERIKRCAKKRIFSEEHRTNIGLSKKGKLNPKLALARKGKYLLEKNSNWRGGKSFEPYGLTFNRRFKEVIKQRDNYSCSLCNIFDDDCLKLHKKRLSIHHIDYDKKNTFPQNCITLCLRCNNLVNKDREIWTKHFQELLKKLYNYGYTQDQKIIIDFFRKK